MNNHASKSQVITLPISGVEITVRPPTEEQIDELHGSLTTERRAWHDQFNGDELSQFNTRRPRQPLDPLLTSHTVSMAMLPMHRWSETLSPYCTINS